MTRTSLLHEVPSISYPYTCVQVPVIQLLLGQVGLVSGDQMLSIWRYVVVGAVVAAAVLTPSTDPLTQVLLAGPLLGLYFGGAWVVKLIGRWLISAVWTHGICCIRLFIVYVVTRITGVCVQWELWNQTNCRNKIRALYFSNLCRNIFCWCKMKAYIFFILGQQPHYLADNPRNPCECFHPHVSNANWSWCKFVEVDERG